MESGNIKKKNKLLIVLISIVSVACLGIAVIIYNGFVGKENNELVEASSFLTEENNSNNDLIDSFYYEDLKVYAENWIYFVNNVVTNIQKGNVSNEEELVSISNDFLLFSQSFNPQPNTENDETVHEHFMDLKYDAEKVVEYGLQYITKKDKVYQTMQKDSFDNTNIHLDTLSRLEEKYYSEYK